MNENELTHDDVTEIDCFHGVDDNIIIGMYTNIVVCARKNIYRKKHQNGKMSEIAYNWMYFHADT
jgi:hypothetical protein